VNDPAGISDIMWRPRLTGLLDEKKEAEIQSNLKNYRKIYEDEDFKITNRKEWERKERRERQKKEVSYNLSASFNIIILLFSYSTVLGVPHRQESCLEADKG